MNFYIIDEQKRILNIKIFKNNFLKKIDPYCETMGVHNNESCLLSPLRSLRRIIKNYPAGTHSSTASIFYIRFKK